MIRSIFACALMFMPQQILASKVFDCPDFNEITWVNHPDGPKGTINKDKFYGELNLWGETMRVIEFPHRIIVSLEENTKAAANGRFTMHCSYSFKENGRNVIAKGTIQNHLYYNSCVKFRNGNDQRNSFSVRCEGEMDLSQD